MSDNSGMGDIIVGARVGSKLAASGIRFNRHSDEQSCSGSLVENDHEVACLRTAGHDPPCEPVMRLAAKLDGVCAWCRVPIGIECHAWCPCCK